MHEAGGVLFLMFLMGLSILSGDCGICVMGCARMGTLDEVVGVC